MLVRSSCIALVGIAAVEAFAPSALLRAAPSQRGHVGVSMVSGGESVSVSRRKALVLLSTLPLALGSSSPAEAKKAGTARLNAEGNPETKEERGERIRKMREGDAEKRAALDVKEKELMEGKEATEVEMGSNLKGDYYYPTGRKRYLPRIKKAYEDIQVLKEELTTDPQWDKLAKFAKGSGDVGGAMSLYVSAAGGGGLSINAKFFENMKAAATEYNGALGTLKAATGKKDPTAAYGACEGMEAALLSYRSAGKPMGLEGADWGVGEIPDCKRGQVGQGGGKMSACSTGSSFGNSNPNLYQRNNKAD